MGVQVIGNSGVVQEVSGTVFRAGHVIPKPLEYGALGHYRITQRILSDAAQTAGARILELKNNGANLIIPTRLVLRALQVAAGTAQENSLDVYRATGFTAVDTTNTSTPVPTVKRTTGMGAAPGNAQLRVKTAVAAGMTGGTLTLDAQPIGTLPYSVAAAIATTYTWGPVDVFDDVNGTHPLVLAQNEGIVIQNRVLNVTSYGIAWFIDLAWAEVPAF